MILIIIKILSVIFLLGLAILVHELGHWLWFKRNLNLPFNLKWWYKSPLHCGLKSTWNATLTPEQEINSLLSGVGAGLLVIFVIGLASGYNHFMFAIPVYMAGCNSDITKLIDLIKKKNKIGVI